MLKEISTFLESTTSRIEGKKRFIIDATNEFCMIGINNDLQRKKKILVSKV